MSNFLTMKCEKLSYPDIDKISYLQPDGWSDIKDAFRLYVKLDFCNPVKITLNNKIVGVGNSTLFGSSAWLAHIIVDSDYRSRGIGYAIVNYLLKEINSRGIESSLLIATEIGEPLYKKAGFREVMDYCYLKRDSLSADENYSSMIKPYKDEYYREILELDRYISGENREMLIKDYLNGSFLFLRDDVIEGFFIPQLEEGPVYALTADAGRELMRLKHSKINKATLPSGNKAGINFLKEMGFYVTDTKGKRMVSGNDVMWKPEMIYSRIAGNFG